MICNCKRCGKVIDAQDQLCTSCIEEEEREFKKIKEFLIENPFATVFQVATLLDVPIQNIKRYLRQNRLEIVERDNQKNEFLTCQRCGAPISSGHYCMSCATTVPHGYSSAVIRQDKGLGSSYSKTKVAYAQQTKRYAS